MPIYGQALTKRILHYVLTVGEEQGVEQLMKQSHRLPQPVRGELMTFAEKLEARGEARGMAMKAEQTAIKALKTGADPAFVSHITDLSLERILELKADLETKK